jgi:acetoin utilization protein AcuB
MENCVCHLPVVQDGKLIGVVSAETVVASSDKTTPVMDYKDDLIHAYVTKDQHLLEVLRVMADHNLTAVPVVDDDAQTYIGTVPCISILKHLAGAYNFSAEGGIIMLNVGIKDYVLAEIAGIVESNNAKILSLYTHINADESRLLVTIKLNTPDLKTILATFYRYDYDVVIYVGHDYTQDEIKERYDLLMRFMNI